jgi:hypothetical protein
MPTPVSPRPSAAPTELARMMMLVAAVRIQVNSLA